MDGSVDEEVPESEQANVSVRVDFVAVGHLVRDQLVHLASFELDLLLVELLVHGSQPVAVSLLSHFVSSLLVVHLEVRVHEALSVVVTICRRVFYFLLVLSLLSFLVSLRLGRCA
jgi:hypothetical protein